MSHKKLDTRGSPSRLKKDVDWETTGSEVIGIREAIKETEPARRCGNEYGFQVGRRGSGAIGYYFRHSITLFHISRLLLLALQYNNSFHTATSVIT